MMRDEFSMMVHHILHLEATQMSAHNYSYSYVYELFHSFMRYQIVTIYILTMIVHLVVLCLIENQPGMAILGGQIIQWENRVPISSVS